MLTDSAGKGVSNPAKDNNNNRYKVTIGLTTATGSHY
jgi:hypothetical protein